MDKKYDIMSLIDKKQALDIRLKQLLYGSIEIRKNDSNQYIYVHCRENGILVTKYVGEYSDDLYNLIFNNGIEAKKIKKEIKTITKKLEDLGYFEVALTDDIRLNIDFAKRHLVDSIYKQAILEGVATTYADTENIIEGGKVKNMTTDDVLKIVNLKHAWEFILNESIVLLPNDLSLLCEINKMIEDGFYYNAGKLRNTPVNIGGTKWKPELPFESQIKEDLEAINDKRNGIDKAIDLLLYVMKKQIFIDGNKRTAVLLANHYLISRGLGILAIPEELIEQYKSLLIEYYETNKKSNIVKFLKEKCYVSLT